MKFNTKTIESNRLKSNKILGFWTYLMSDLIFFSTIFSVYFVLKDRKFHELSKDNIFNSCFFMIKTCVLLFNSFICNIFTYKISDMKKKIYISRFLLLIFILGIFFLFIESLELYQLFISGYTPKKNSFLSSIFILIFSHDIRIFFGVIWTTVIFLQIYFKNLNYFHRTQVYCLSMFWNFLEIIWMFIFLFIYLLGSI